jgi:hypothetical protein
MLAAGSAQSQTLNMDMSWALRAQQNYWNQGQAAAYSTAMQYYRYMQQLRAAGYTGPSLPTGVTNESLRASINAANNATQSYIRASADNSRRTSNAVNDYDMRAIRGCQYGYDRYGRWGYICP